MELILLDLRYPTDYSVLLFYKLLRRLFSRTFWSHILVAHFSRTFASQICDRLRKYTTITGTSAMKIAFGNG